MKERIREVDPAKSITEAALTNKGRFKELLENIPVNVILNDKAALIGAAYCATLLK
jgi:glucokinase